MMRAAVRVLDAFCLLTLLTLISALFFDVSILNSMNALSRAGCDVEQQYDASFLGDGAERYEGDAAKCARFDAVASVGDIGTTSCSLCATSHH